MSLIGEGTIANNGVLSVKDTKISEILGIKLTAGSIPVQDGLFRMSDLVAYLKGIVVNTKTTRKDGTLAVNVTMYDLIVSSTDFKGLAKGSITRLGGAGLELNVPIVQADGRLDIDWQIDVTNKTGASFDVQIYGSSKRQGTMYVKYSPNSLSNELNATIDTNFNKIMIQNTFNQIDTVVSGISENIRPEDGIIETNLSDEIVIAMDVIEADTTITQSILLPSDTGYYILYNTDNQRVSYLKLYRETNSDPAINYMMSTLTPAN